MIVTAISKDEIYQITLPDKVKGQYYLYSTKNNHKEKIASIEGINESWILKSLQGLRIKSARDNKLYKKAELNVLNIFTLIDKKNTIYVFTEPITADRQTFKKYVFEDNTEISIGRDKKCDICFKNGSVSQNHAKLNWSNNKWTVQDLNSTNGTFVNNKRVEYAQLKFGDVVFAMGLKIILGKNFIAINNPDGNVKVSNKFDDFIPQEIKNDITDDDIDIINIDSNYFYRSPRFKRDIETAKINVDSPPASPIGEETPMLLVLGTSMTMGMMSLVTLISALATFNIMSMAMGGSMLLGTVLFPIITKNYEKNRKYKKEKLRQKKYKEYLDKKYIEIDEAKQLQEEILHENVITVTQCEERILEKKRSLWERSFGQNDFLTVRLGLGNADMDLDISLNEKKFSLEEDNLEEELYMMCGGKRKLENVPISLSLYDDKVCGVIGQREQVVDFAKGIIMQIAALYSYDEVKMIFVYNEEENESFDFVKWLPHCWSEDNSFRFVATNTNECNEISAYLDRVIESRLSNTNNNSKQLPYYLIVCMDKKLELRTEVIKKVLANSSDINFSMISFYDSLNNLPKEATRVIELKNNKCLLFDNNDISGNSIKFDNDLKLVNSPALLSKRLANIYLDVQNSNFNLPDMITFLNLYNVGKVEHLNVGNRWVENDPTKSLSAVVGVNTLGDKFNLDLHEKFHGPHGLVAGMTGSGKSEFIITYILSMAVNYHPEEVQFVMIDYKGGGMAKSFENLPHTVGIITNLDGSAIKRSLVSIESELKRRQAIFNEASKQTNISNIDIYKYQKLYREGQVSEPLSHLFIISDEFAELKTQQPEFMKQLISAARIGRSLGVHLILATQKPSGVVDDQIWSNSRFRVCLKVQEKADSQDMLKRPDAAELKETGRFYLQVGYNELFELGQSAWSGAPYYPSENAVSEIDESIEIIDNNGHVITGGKLDKRDKSIKNPNKQVDEITSYLQEIAEEENIHPRLLWLEPIKPIIIYNDIVKQYSIEQKRFYLNPVIGVYDDPSKQQQCSLTVPFVNEGNVIVYGFSGSGKTTFFTTLTWALINSHTPDEVNIYILDFASETLRSFKNAPQVGDVVVSSEEEKVHNLFKMISDELKLRKKLFSDYGGDYVSYIKNSNEKLPSIVVMFNNYSVFSELYEELEDKLTLLTRDGYKYGIYFILSTTTWNGVKFRLSQNFKQSFCLQLNDESDYSSIIGRTDGLYPSKYKGRGLIKLDKIYEFQTACVTNKEDVFKFIKDKCLKFKNNWEGKIAKRIPVLPDVVNSSYLEEFYDKNNALNIPVGIQTSSIDTIYYDFSKHYINLVLSTTNDYKNFIQGVVNLAEKSKNITGWILDSQRAIVNDSNDIFVNCHSNEEIKNAISNIFDLVLYRNNTYKTDLENGKTPEVYDDKFVIINSISSINNLDNESKEKLSLFLEKGCSTYNVFFVISEQVGNITSYSYEKWYKNHITGMNGIWIGNGVTDQYQFNINRSSRDLRKQIPIDYGFVINKSNATKCKLLNN